MPDQYKAAKTSLVNDLWLPLAIIGGDELFPRRKKQKRMKMFTLTNMDYQEIVAFKNAKLIKREDVIAWNHNYIQAIRLETELGRSKIVCERRFEDEVIDDSQPISADLSCDIFNLDYVSQDPDSVRGRIEREIICGKVLVGLLSNFQSSGFVLLYTTLLDQVDLTLSNLNFPIQHASSYPNPISETGDKVTFIKEVMTSVIREHDYNIHEPREMIISLGNLDNVFSFGFVSLRT